MLGHVGRRLRMAGYDTIIDRGETSDADLIERAKRENRLFLTCDKKIQEIKGAEDLLIYLDKGDEISWAKYLSHHFDVNWTHAPFTYCIDCNRPLEAVPSAAYDRLPLNIKQQGQSGRYCPSCDKVFWEGSHVERMKQQLQKLNEI